MVKKSKLFSALDAHRNVDYNLQKQKKLQEQAAKRKRYQINESSSKRGKEPSSFFYNGEPFMSGALQRVASGDKTPSQEEDGVSESEDNNQASEQEDRSKQSIAAIDTSHIDDSDSNSSSGTDEPHPEEPTTNGIHQEQPPSKEPEEASDDELDPDASEDDIPLSELSDLSDSEKGDIIPHQRLTINNTTALTKAYSSIALPIPDLPFSEHQTITSSEPISIPDINDDLNRELAFHKQCLLAAKEGRSRLKKEGVPFSRPPDYFAEMVKSDEQMGKVKQRMTDEAANRKAAAEARKQRDLRKFGKQVQIAKLQDRDKAKRETLEKINILKRSGLLFSPPLGVFVLATHTETGAERKNTDTGGAEEADLFDVALEDASKTDKTGRSSSRPGQGGRGPSSKRQKKDDKFGFGGKKRFAKSGDAISSSDLRAFNSRKMKGQKKGSQRLGKSRRAQR
ncbi:MAG: hypothetical protein Q9209_004974 [Squamulea sp. 1 TL-2023]